MRNIFPIVVLCLVPGLASPVTASELRLDGAAIAVVLTDHVFAGSDGSRKTEQIFQKSGATYYSVDGAQSQGRWQVRGDQYCSQWPPNEGWSCFDVLRDGAAITFISASGKRYGVTRAD